MNKKPYSPPTVEQNVAGMMNKFGHGHTSRAYDKIDGVDVNALAAEHGSPLFIFSERQIRQKYRDAHQAFTKRYPKTQFAWSYKTNYLSAVCNVYHSEGAIAEVVSDFEYEKARRQGVPGKQIIANGPYKPEPFLRRAAQDGAKIHIDNLDELLVLEKIAEEMDRQVDVGIRVNMDTGTQPAWTKFGFNLENGEAQRAITRITAENKLRLVGLHTHIGTFMLDPNAYRIAATKLISLADKFKEDSGQDLEYLDMGGGFASTNTLHYQYLPGEQVSPTFDDYAEAITDAFNTRYTGDGHRPTLMLETGRALIDEAGYLLSTVIAKKRTPLGKRAIIIDAGVNLLYTTNWYKLRVVPTGDFPEGNSEVILYGPLCMNIDVVREQAYLPQVNVGDTLMIFPAGAYTLTQSMQFITYRPAVVMIGMEGEVDVIREREALEYVEALERMPARLEGAYESANPGA